MNAYRHGLTGQTLLITDEQVPIYKQLCDDFAASFQAANVQEKQMVQRLADLQWRLNVVPAKIAEIEAMDVETLDEMERIVKMQATLSLYEQRLSRSFRDEMKLLRALQAERQTEEKAGLPKAAQLRKYYKKRGEAWDPAADGFVCSLSAIDRHIRLSAFYARN